MRAHHHSHDEPHHHAHPHAPAGHNRQGPAALQWQVPHRPGPSATPTEPEVRDLDLVEASFVEGFAGASDPTSFLRLAGIPFSGADAGGRVLHLLRCEVEAATDVGAVMPLIGGAAMRYDPLPKPLVSRRRRLSFVYHDGSVALRLDFAQARALLAVSESAPLQLSR